MIRWRGVLLREDVETGDHRLIEAGATRWRELPRDLGCVFEDGFGGHENAIVIGTIETIERVGADIMGDGPVLMGNDDADKWVNMNRQGALRGCSVDLTGGECIIEVVNIASGEVLDPEIGIEVLWGPEGDDYYIRERWTDAEIGSTAVCRVPAFAEALIEVYDTDDEAGGGAGNDEVVEDPGGGDPELAARTFAAVEDVEVGQAVRWTDDNGDHTGTITEVDEENESVTVQVDVGEDDEPMEVVVSIGQIEIITDDEGDDEEGDGEAASGFPELARRSSAAASVRPALAALLARDRGEVVTASLVAGVTDGAVVQAAVSWGTGPPADAFARRELARPMPFTIEDDGRVFGHLRTRGQCHMGFMGGAFSRCVTVPDSPSEYSLFHANRQVRCDDGSRMRVGIIALDSGHAPAGRPGRRPSLAATQSWYEQTGLQACYVHAYDDEWGTQVCGILRDGLAVDDARRAMASSPSGDWRDWGEGLDLTGIAFVSVPGYPILSIEDDEPQVLLASLSPTAVYSRSWPGPGTTAKDAGSTSASGNGARNGATSAGSVTPAAELPPTTPTPPTRNSGRRLGSGIATATASATPTVGCSCGTASTEQTSCGCGTHSDGDAGSATSGFPSLRSRLEPPASTTTTERAPSEVSSAGDATGRSGSGKTTQPSPAAQQSGSNPKALRRRSQLDRMDAAMMPARRPQQALRRLAERI